MRFRFSTIVFFFIFIFTSSIITAENICLITDVFWNTMIENEMSQNPGERLKKKISEAIPFFSGNSLRINNKKIGRIIIETDMLSEIEYVADRVNSADSEIFILSPLISDMQKELAEKFPDRFFISFSEGETENPGNVSFFKIDYADAYFKAGEWAALQKSGVHAIFYTGSDRLKRARQSFEKGWTSKMPLQKLNLKTFDSVDDVTTDYIAEFTEQLQTGDVTAAIFCGPHNESFINSFDGTSVQIVSEYIKSWSESSYNWAASVEVPVTGILAVIIKSVGAGTYMDGGTVKAELFVYEYQ